MLALINAIATIIAEPSLSSKQKFIIVGREDTISEDLNFEQVVHTVYQLIPQGACFVNNNSIDKRINSK